MCCLRASFPHVIMLLRSIHARVLWCGPQEILEAAPDSLSGLWKRKSVVEVSVFPSDVLTEGLVNWDVARQS